MRQRLDEMQGGESAALQDQVRAVAPADVQQHGSDSIAGLVQAVTKIVDTLMNDKTRNLIMILTSPRYSWLSSILEDCSCRVAPSLSGWRFGPGFWTD